MNEILTQAALRLAQELEKSDLPLVIDLNLLIKYIKDAKISIITEIEVTNASE